jgi:hypothetical protein
MKLLEKQNNYNFEALEFLYSRTSITQMLPSMRKRIL